MKQSKCRTARRTVWPGWARQRAMALGVVMAVASSTTFAADTLDLVPSPSLGSASAAHAGGASHGEHAAPVMASVAVAGDELVTSSSLLHMPMPEARLTSLFGMRIHPVKHSAHGHTGIDLAAPRGSPVYSAAGGIVERMAFDRTGYGRYIVVRHDSSMETVYGHLSAYVKGMRPGERVAAGQLIGAVGSTGMATGPHLHFEVRRDGVPVDPIAYLDDLGESMLASAPQPMMRRANLSRAAEGIKNVATR